MPMIPMKCSLLYLLSITIKKYVKPNKKNQLSDVRKLIDPCCGF